MTAIRELNSLPLGIRNLLTISVFKIYLFCDKQFTPKYSTLVIENRSIFMQEFARSVAHETITQSPFCNGKPNRIPFLNVGVSISYTKTFQSLHIQTLQYITHNIHIFLTQIKYSNQYLDPCHHLQKLCRLIIFPKQKNPPI